MKYIYFHIDEFNRDAITASVLKNEFKKHGWVLIYGNRVTSHILKYFEWAFDAVILPKPTFINSFFGYEKISSLKSKYVMLYTENIGIIANDKFPKMVLKGALDEEFMSGRTACVERVDAFCFWGAQVAGLVKKTYASIENKCFIVGHPRHDLKALNNKNSKKNTVGLISRYCTINDYYSKSPIEQIFDRYTKKQMYEYYNNYNGDYLKWERRGQFPEEDLYLEAVDIKNTILLIISLNERGYKVSFKIHPREKTSTWIEVFKKHNLKVEIVNSDIPFTHWAQDKLAIVGPPSTSFYDCLMIGTRPISISNLYSEREQFVSKLYEENNKLMPYIDSPNTIDDLILLLDKPLNLSSKVLKVLRLEADYPNCKDSAMKIGNVLKTILKESSKGYLRMALGRQLYSLISFLFNFSIGIGRRLKILGASHSANFLLTPSTIKHINRMVKK